LSHPDPRLGWLQLAGAAFLGETLKASLIKTFGDPQRVLAMPGPQLFSAQGWTAGKHERFIRERGNFSPLCSPEKLDRTGVRMITFNDPLYPALLKQTPDAPIVLFALGNVELLQRPTLAIVGSRNGTQLGFDVTRQFARDCARAGFVIVSGLALGIDTFAHLGALDAGGGTIAVLGCGPDVVYPNGNRQIRTQILQKGLLLSEFPPQMPARPWHFPVRNRIIAGLCSGTLVVEATAQSGSLITAKLAMDRDREVFAIPGPITSELAKGTLALINNGAQMVTSPQDIIRHYAHLLPQLAAPIKEEDDIDLTPAEKTLLAELAAAPVHLDKLLVDQRWRREELFSLLMTLELRDFVVKYPGNFFQAKVKPR
jgi:DNA processing protein